MFLAVAKKSRTFPVSHVQLMSRCAGAGKEHRQSPSWPTEIFHTIDGILSLKMEVGQEVGTLFFHEFDHFL